MSRHPDSEIECANLGCETCARRRTAGLPCFWPRLKREKRQEECCAALFPSPGDSAASHAVSSARTQSQRLPGPPYGRAAQLSDHSIEGRPILRSEEAGDGFPDKSCLAPSELRRAAFDLDHIKAGAEEQNKIESRQNVFEGPRSVVWRQAVLGPEGGRRRQRRSGWLCADILFLFA
jgi:hypothetical protein